MKAIRACGRLLAVLALIPGCYFLAGWIGSSLPGSSPWSEPPTGPDTVEIMVATNGVHTSIVMPRQHADMDWTQLFPASDLADPVRPYTHIAISWGQREVFLDTPTWADLSPWLVLRIVGRGGDGLMHVEHFVRPRPSSRFRPMRLSRARYRALVAALNRDLPPDIGDPARKVYPGYGNHDAFYEASGHYTIWQTCNEWTGETLRLAGLPTGAWTPFASSVMKWVPPPTAATPP